MHTRPSASVAGMDSHRSILTERIEIAVDGEPPMGAYLARPTAPGPFPGVVVAPELFGVSAHVRDVCERLAALGYRALTPDLHHRTAPGVELSEDATGRERGFGLLHQMTRDHVLTDVRAAIDHLRVGLTGTPRVGMVGLSVGGHVAYLAATELDLAAVAVLYGGWIPTTEIPLSRPEPTLARTPAIAGRMLLLVGEHDHIVLPEHRQAIAQALHDAGIRHETREYPDTAHGFLSDRRDAYQPQAADDAWRLIKALLAEELR